METMQDKETKEFGKEWQDEQREKMVRIQFPKTIQRIEQEAERRGLEKALGFIIGEGNISWAKDKIVESIKLLEEENGKQNAR